MPEKLYKEDIQCLIRKLTKESKKTTESIDSDIAFYKDIIDELEQEKIRIEKYNTVDKLSIGFITAQSNYPSWNYWLDKGNLLDPLYLSIGGSQSNAPTSLSLGEMAQLRDYLTDKLEFAEYE